VYLNRNERQALEGVLETRKREECWRQKGKKLSSALWRSQRACTGEGEGILLRDPGTT
jgi:hypothetical protein